MRGGTRMRVWYRTGISGPSYAYSAHQRVRVRFVRVSDGFGCDAEFYARTARHTNQTAHAHLVQVRQVVRARVCLRGRQQVHHAGVHVPVEHVAHVEVLKGREGVRGGHQRAY